MKGSPLKSSSPIRSDIAKASIVILITAALCGCSCTTSGAAKNRDTKTGIANPASVNCIHEGGTLSIQKRGDRGEYGICIFADNRQCEEWALFRGECPIGGIKITGNMTPAAQYCVITGGTYDITGKSNTDQERGICSFGNGKSCDARDYYDGKCSKNKE